MKTKKKQKEIEEKKNDTNFRNHYFNETRSISISYYITIEMCKEKKTYVCNDQKCFIPQFCVFFSYQRQI